LKIPKYYCQDCGAISYGWGSKGICRVCGGALKAVIEKEEEEINEEYES